MQQNYFRISTRADHIVNKIISFHYFLLHQIFFILIFNINNFLSVSQLIIEMFSYNTAVKVRSAKSPKVSPDMTHQFKNPSEAPKRISKENQNPKDYANHHPDIKIENKKMDQVTKHVGLESSSKLNKSKIIEGDISKIAQSYVLQGNFLKKQQAYQQAIRNDRKKTLQSAANKENSAQGKTIERKEILKLEYLQKMGFLRADEKEILAQYRKRNPGANNVKQNKEVKSISTSVQLTSQPSQGIGNLNVRQYENQYPEYLQMYSTPKNMDPKMISRFFTSNSKMMYGHRGY